MAILRDVSKVAVLALGCVIAILLTNSAWAQLSPGDLHETHAFLDGVANCGKCHGAKQQILAENCLACHSSIRRSLDTKSGLHGRNEYLECNLCHVEHQGRNYELIFWKDGQRAFDHTETGYQLEGKHARVECQKCHRSGNIVDREKLIADKRNLTRTFLGLSVECASCHVDEHRGQVGKDCTRCHTTAGWRPVAGFDHAKTKFALSGKHLTLLCDKCHKTRIDSQNSADSTYVQLTGIAHQQCIDCHRDAHQGKFGVNCSGCHTTESWKSSNRANLDHGRTRFPLQGKHAGLACEKCHKPGQPFAGLKFDNCRACHEDYHRGEFASRAAAGACEECHQVSGFRPSKFTIDQHQQSGYPLRGAHLAVPCDGCHRDKIASGAGRFQFAFKSTNCQSCHGDPHRGSQKTLASDATCESCHNVDSWQQVAFDHAKTKFPLAGKHASTACRSCHYNKERAFDPAAMKFALTNFACSDCHVDIHRGQFALATATPATDCARCHFSSRWSELKFDHNRDSAYKLEGAHTKVPCSGCHKQESTDSTLIVRYKPLGTDCRACHATDLLQNRTRP